MADSGNIRPRPTIQSLSNQRPATPPILSSTPPSSSRSGQSITTAVGHATGGQTNASKATNSHVYKEKTGSNKDVGKLVDAYKNIQMLSWPVVLLHEFLSTVISWEYPILTIGIWLTLQVFSLYMTAGQFLVICFLMLSIVATLGYVSYTNHHLTEEHIASKKQHLNNFISANSLSPSSSSTSSLASSSTQAQGTASISSPNSQKVRGGGNSQKGKSTPSSSPPKTSSSSSSSSPPPSSGDSCLATSHHERKGGKKHGELEVNSQRRKELLVEYRKMMQDLSRWLTVVSSVLLRMEELLLWRCRWKSLLFYLTLYISVLCIIFLPFRWITMATTNCLLLTHPQFYVGLERIKNLFTSKERPKEESLNQTNVSTEKGHGGSHLQKDGIVSLHPLSQDLNGNEDTDEEMTAERGTGGFQIVAPPSTGPEGAAPIHKQQQQQPPKKFESGMCYLCGTLFTSVLKRRRYCRYCGRDFCPKCCSKKLPRSALGATAPAAQTEKELVCNLCIIKLTGEEVGSSRVR